jgi:hypothetical protein
MVRGVLLENKHGRAHHTCINHAQRVTSGVETMNLLSTPVARVSTGALWWNWLVHQRKPNRKDERPAPIDAEELSNHILRDLGILDGRIARGERPGTDIRSELLRDTPKRF